MHAAHGFRARARGRKARAAGARGRASSYQLSAPPLRAQVAPCATQLTASLRSPEATIRAHHRSTARVGQPSDNISSGPVGVTRGLPPQISAQIAQSICAGRGLSRMRAARCATPLSQALCLRAVYPLTLLVGVRSERGGHIRSRRSRGLHGAAPDPHRCNRHPDSETVGSA